MPFVNNHPWPVDLAHHDGSRIKLLPGQGVKDEKWARYAEPIKGIVRCGPDEKVHFVDDHSAKTLLSPKVPQPTVPFQPDIPKPAANERLYLNQPISHWYKLIKGSGVDHLIKLTKGQLYGLATELSIDVQGHHDVKSLAEYIVVSLGTGAGKPMASVSHASTAPARTAPKVASNEVAGSVQPVEEPSAEVSDASNDNEESSGAE